MRASGLGLNNWVLIVSKQILREEVQHLEHLTF